MTSKFKWKHIVGSVLSRVSFAASPVSLRLLVLELSIGAFNAHPQQVVGGEIPQSPAAAGLTRAPLGYLAERALSPGGADSAPCLTPERMVVERREKRQTKALNKTNLRNTKQFA